MKELLKKIEQDHSQKLKELKEAEIRKQKKELENCQREADLKIEEEKTVIFKIKGLIE